MEFTGMLPAAIEKFDSLMDTLTALGLSPRVTQGFNGTGGEADLRTWGVVCNMSCADMGALATEAAALGITVQEDGSLAYTAGLAIDDFKTRRVDGTLTLQPENEEV
jgi:hypothetical protein